MPDALDTAAAIVAGFASLHDELAASHPKLVRGRVWCRGCGRSERAACPEQGRGAATCLRSGWPKCCGATMTIDAPVPSPEPAPAEAGEGPEERT